MTTPPDPRVTRHAGLTTLLDRTRARVRLLAFARGASSGAVAAIIIAAFAWWRGWPAWPVAAAGALIAIVLGTLALRATSMRDVDVATLIEKRQSHDNLLVTGAELLARQSNDAYVPARVLDAASISAARIDLRALFPARRTIATLSALGVVWIATIAAGVVHPAAVVPLAIDAATATGTNISAYDVVITPPAYLAQKPVRVRNASQIAATAGSRIDMRIVTAADSVSAETLDGNMRVQHTGRNLYATSITANRDGFIALQSVGAAGRTTDRRMVTVTVSPDAPPRVRITSPGKDLHINDSTRVIDIAIDADDDHALASLALRYTRVSGSGEQFSFSEGEIPVTIGKTDARTWVAHGKLALASLKLTAGDMVVYRAAALDARPGATPSLSDAFIVEINAPGDERKAGFAADDEQDKYALSQEMVIQKTRELIARAPRMVSDSIHDAAMMLAAEQRSVRAEFVFMMGGEVAEDVIDAADANELHEEAEAQGEADLAAGRAVNKSHVALVDAIRAMSQANASLTAFDLDKGLAAEQSALTSLQAAFSHTRYILRGLTQHEQLDLTRRLSGQMAGAAGSTAPATANIESPRAAALRAVLAGIDTIRASTHFDASLSSRAAALGISASRVDPSSRLANNAARLLNEASIRMLRNDANGAQMRLDSAAVSVAALLHDAQSTSVAAASASLRGLAGALRDAIRKNRQ